MKELVIMSKMNIPYSEVFPRTLPLKRSVVNVNKPTFQALKTLTVRCF